MRTVVLVAARDAEDSIASTVSALASLGLDGPVLVVDDGSRDATAMRARAAGARVISLPQNVGKGAAVTAGIAAAPDAGVYLLVDADVNETAAAVLPLLKPVVDGEADMTIGVLPPAGTRAGVGMVKRLARSAIRRTTGRTIEAPLSGQRAVRGELLRSLRLADRFGLETAMTLDALRAGARVSEVPVAMDHRHTGRTVAGFKHRALQGRDIVRALWPRLTGARARVAVIVLGLLVALVGSIWSGYRAIPHSVAFGGVAVHRERIYYRIALAFIVAQAIVYAGAIVLLAGRRRRGRDIPVAAPALRAASLLIAGFPLATFLYRTVPDSPRFGSSAFAVMLAIDAVLVAGVWRLRAHRLQALGWVLGLTAAVLVVDVSTGGRLQEPSIMGYSPHIAGRFYGIGKTAFAILAASVILPAAIHLERAPRRSEALVAVGALFVLAIVIDGAPMLGDDVGGMLTLVPALGLLMVAFSRRTGHSPLRAGVVAALVAGLVGSVVHGSGVIATAMVFVFVGPFLMTLAPLA